MQSNLSFATPMRKELILQALVRTLPLRIWAIDPQGTFISYERNEPVPSDPPPQILGKNIFELYPEIGPWIRQALAGKRTHWLGQEDSGAYVENWVLPIHSEQGETIAAVGIVLDISKGKHLEHYLRSQLALVRRQRQIIRELSTPIIEVWDSVLMLPVIGLLDSTWTDELMKRLLSTVAERRARFAILDLTGVETVDADAATYLTDLVSAMRLVGTEGIVTGIRSKVAQTLSSLGHDLSGVTTLGSLKAGLMHCITRMRQPTATSQK